MPVESTSRVAARDTMLENSVDHWFCTKMEMGHTLIHRWMDIAVSDNAQ